MAGPTFQPNTILSYFGTIALLLSAILILGSMGIIAIGNIKVTRGYKTLIAGIILAIGGGIMLVPEIKTSSGSTLPTSITTASVDISTTNIIIPAITPSQTALANTITTTPVTSAIEDHGLNKKSLDHLLGEGTWFCFSERQDAVGTNNLPKNLAVQLPIAKIERNGLFYTIGDTVSGSGSATIWLEGILPSDECPNLTHDTTPIMPNKSALDSVLGIGNWRCLDNIENAVIVLNIPNEFLVQSPVSSVDKNGQKYGLGQYVPPGGEATIWLQFSLSKGICPSL